MSCEMQSPYVDAAYILLCMKESWLLGSEVIISVVELVLIFVKGSHNKDRKLAQAFNSSFRCINDVLSPWLISKWRSRKEANLWASVLSFTSSSLEIIQIWLFDRHYICPAWCCISVSTDDWYHGVFKLCSSTRWFVSTRSIDSY
jgi:hypothetical protein